MALGGLRRIIDGVPLCPMCDGPCTHEFERSEYVIPDRLPKAKDGSADPEPAPPVKRRPRGKRAIHGPAEDRMRRPSEDR